MAPAMRAVSPCCSRPDQDQFASAFSVAEPSPGALGRDRQGIPVRNEFTRPAPSLTSAGYLPERHGEHRPEEAAARRERQIRTAMSQTREHKVKFLPSLNRLVHLTASNIQRIKQAAALRGLTIAPSRAGQRATTARHHDQRPSLLYAMAPAERFLSTITAIRA